MVKNLKTFVILLSIAAACQFVITSGAASEQSASRLTVDFARDVRPIFERNCFGCHGAERAMSQLRLDVKRLAMGGGQSGAVVIPGDSKASLLMRRVLGLGGEQQMPLGKEPLKPEQIEILRRWIDEGAVWPEGESGKAGKREIELPKHWAYVNPVRPQLPSVKDSKWVRNPIDRFILSRLEKEGLRPSPEADKSTLIRRLSLDLTGLPPTLEEIDDFLADTSPRAYENLVERLLASPHYGERWGRWWLDAARYADTNGFEKDRDRSIWPYRDWVINAFNADKPFDQFMIEQIAGDLLPDATLDQRIATGFLRNSMLNEEGAVDPEQFRVEGLIDRVDAIGKAFLGMTLNCAQCHAHKFDPIKHDEYYRFYAFLNQDEEPEIEVPIEAEKKKRAGILAGVAKIEDELLAKNPDLPQRMAEWELKAREDQVDWTVLENAEVIGTNGVKFDELLDRSFIPRGDNPPTVVYYVKAKTDLKNITGFRLELLPDHTLPRGGPGRSTLGMALLSEFTVEAAPAAQPDKWKRLTLIGATADYAAENSIRLAIDGNPKTSWSIDAGPGLRNQERRAVFTPQSPVAGYDGGALLKFSLEQKEFGGGAAERFEAPNIGRFRISLTTAPQPKADPLPPNARRILSIPAGQRTAEQRREVFRYYRTTVPEFAEANKAATDLMRRWPYAATTLVVTPRPVPRETRVFKRGDWKRPGEAVTPGAPSFLHPFPSDAPRNRLGLARWIADKNNPLTARVIVNRVWQQYFGQGMVLSPEDFGMRCETPSHPELLDWLAVEFRDGATGRQDDGAIDRDSQWSLKRIHKLIVMSATYRQSSTIKPDAALFATEFKFAKHGQSGAEMSEALAHLPKVANQITIIRSMMTDAINHAPAQIFMQTGSMQFGRPSFGSWVTYGLGSEARDLPAFVVLSSAGGASGGSSLWGSGFLPSVYQGVAFRRSGDPILSLANPRGVSREMQRDSLDALKDLNEHLMERAGDAEIATRINSFEMAYRMQESAPELMDLSKETKSTLELYGAEPGKNTYANNCLLARRLVERGVRFVQLYHEAWDHHGQAHKGVKEQCKETDQANTALLMDLKQRGLLDDTIVIWGGEFGRTPMVQGEPDGSNALGRDHHNKAFTMWLAGGGFKPGITIGETDELGFNVAQDPVHVHDLHATILHLLGFDHTKLIYRFQGRDFRLTDVHGVVVEKALA